MPPRIPSFARQSSVTSTLPCPKCCIQSPPTFHLFSTTPPRANINRKKMYEWLNGPGANIKDPLPGSTNYLGAYDIAGNMTRLFESAMQKKPHEAAAQGTLPHESNRDLRPFPLNPNFRSQSVLSEKFREVIWDRVMKQEMSVARVSRDLGVEMNRVGAVVRLKELEKRWVKEGKQLAKPYAKAIMDMLPKTEYNSNSDEYRITAHETINDLPVHKSTGPQLFYPTSESRRFTRADAAKVFDKTLMPADQRIPHPEMIEIKRDKLEGLDVGERTARTEEREQKEKETRELRRQRRLEEQEKALTRVQSPRWEFRFKEISVDDVGVDGRGFHATGFRYGAPHLDRKRGMIKIPKRVLS